MPLYARCRGCGRTIVRDDARQVVSHEAPECDWFADIMNQAPKHERFIEVLAVPDDASKAMDSRGPKGTS